jgi:ATP-dependent DNA helicase RecQ
VWFYCENNETCRSRQLISYFGEENAHDCGQCDVCLKRATYSTKEKASAHAEAVAEAAETIIQWLKDGQEHLIKDLSTLHIPQDILSEALRHLLNEEVVAVDIANIYLP